MLQSLILAISSSIDSLGIGITYGVKNTRITLFSKVILFIISLLITYSSIFLGDFINNFLPYSFTTLLGSGILVIIGISVIIKGFIETNDKKTNYYDFNNSKLIEPKEAFVLGIALSLDSFGIGLSYSLININNICFPLFIAGFQLIFLTIGSYFGRKLNNLINIEDHLYSLLSGILLITIGIYKLF